MILRQGEKIHVVHRRLFERDIRRHFIGEVEAYEDGMVRASGHVFVIEDATKDNVFKKRPGKRTRIIAINSGNLFVNVLPLSVDLEQIRYESKGRDLRITDGSEWHLDVKEFGWT